MDEVLKNLSDVRSLTEKILKDNVKKEDLAVAQYVKSMCDQMSNAGVDLTQYNLVRTVDNRGILNAKVIYSIEKKDEA